MPKKLMPSKVVIEFDDGNFVNGVILYKVNDNSVISRTRTVGLKNAVFNKATLNGIIQKFIAHANKSEGISE